jgi:exosortase D (VPLPA-CTERM-specific)
MSATTPEIAGPTNSYRTPIVLWLWLVAGLALSVLVAREGFAIVTDNWFTRPEYSHGVLIPFVAAFLIWQRRDMLEMQRFTGSWLGFFVAVLGLAIWSLGKLSTVYALSQYALIVMVYGVVLSLVGARIFMKLWAPMLMLLLMIPLPAFFYNNLSSDLQLTSSALGVWMMRLCGISVYLSGNVIDLGHFQMQVVEACDGLRYLFPLMTLGFIVAYVFKAPFWQRLVVFLSSIPITILMNSARIAMIGIFADFGNTSLAEGLLHELQGWALFMVSGAVLLLETVAFTRFLNKGTSWREALGFDRPLSPQPKSPTRATGRPVPLSLVAAAVVLGSCAALSYFVPERAEAHPQRSWFVDFPLTVGTWHGRQGRVEDLYLDALKLDDYLMADYTDGRAIVNLYSAYYLSQRQGESVHSPRSCLPGGGWRIRTLEQVPITEGGQESFRVNRALIELGTDRELVYYWFKQRDRLLTNEYAVKWFIFVDSLMRHRSDGALIRLVTPLRPGDDIAKADERLQFFAREMRARMAAYVPD